MPFLLKIFKALNSNQRPGEIAAGASFALLLGLLPGGNLLWIALFALTFFLKVNLAVQMALLVFFKLLAPAVDPLLHLFGYAILTFPPLYFFFTWIQNAPLLAFTRLNNTLVTGGFAAGLLLWLPSFVFFRFLIRRYREGFLRMIQNTKLYRAFMKLPLVVKFQKAARAVSHLPGRNR